MGSGSPGRGPDARGYALSGTVGVDYCGDHPGGEAGVASMDPRRSVCHAEAVGLVLAVVGAFKNLQRAGDKGGGLKSAWGAERRKGFGGQGQCG